MPLIEYAKIRLRNSRLQYLQSGKRVTLTLVIPYPCRGRGSQTQPYSGRTGHINFPVFGEYHFGDNTIWKQAVQLYGGMLTNHSIGFLLLLSLSTCASTMVILLMTEGLIWTRLSASLGLGSSLWMGSVLWKWVYEGDIAKVHQPNMFHDNDIKLSGPWRWAQAPKDFAFFQVDTGYVIFTPSPVQGVRMLIVRGITSTLAIFALIGYVCQVSLSFSLR